MAARVRPSYRVGVDIGGTFTDIVFLSEDGQLHTKKVSSSVEEITTSTIGCFDQPCVRASK